MIYVEIKKENKETYAAYQGVTLVPATLLKLNYNEALTAILAPADDTGIKTTRPARIGGETITKVGPCFDHLPGMKGVFEVTA